jgi:hypothetical protein
MNMDSEYPITRKKEPGCEISMKLVIATPNSRKPIRQSNRWKKYHAKNAQKVATSTFVVLVLAPVSLEASPDTTGNAGKKATLLEWSWATRGKCDL